ncbi:MAG: GreA/GreB family elongation factor [Verrucomicrobia bacterium]|nr:GreA/GreB family elongation factor [Verrucomicrobiota bacterium]
MREEFEKIAVAGKIEGRHIEPLIHLTTSGYCMHRSWGFGRIKTVDTVFARFTIDFPNKPGHTMDLAFAAESLRPIPKDHVLARKAGDLEGLRQMAALNHLDLIKLVLNSYGGRATADQIQQVLVPDVIRDDWKKWWETAKREMKKDGHFQVPLKKTEPVLYQVEEVSLQDRLLGEFRAAKGLKARVAVATEVVKNSEDLADKQAAANEIIPALNAEIATHQRTQPAVALEAIFVRDDLRTAAGLPPVEGEITAAILWSSDAKFASLMEMLPAAKHRRALESFKAANPEHWTEAVRGALNAVSAKLCREFANLLTQEGKTAELKETLARLISQHSASSDLLLWLGKDRSDAFADILGPEVFRAMLTAMERDQFNEKRSNRLREFVVDDQALLVDLTAAADLDVIKDLTRTLQLSSVFDDMDKRSLLARLVKSHPAVQSLVTGEQTKQEATLVVSWDSLERRNSEYRELVDKKIPANSKEIAIARSYGDLSENHEFKAAKEMQGILKKRKAELEVLLSRARGNDFANARTDVVSIGTIVTAFDLEANQVETFTILGAWDFDADKNIISYLTPVGQALLNRSVGEVVEFELHGAQHRHRIDRIEPYITTAPTAPPLVAETPPPETAAPDAPTAETPVTETPRPAEVNGENPVQA